jgi:predicted phosphodiesterase
MRIAIISDIHGNLIALDAVLAEIATQGADQIVCLDDIAMSGPQPRDVIARLRTLDCPIVRGNCDDLVVSMRARGRVPAAETGHAGLAPWVAAIDYWSAEQLTADDLALLRALPPCIDIPLDGMSHLLCVHGSPRANTDRILPTTPDDVVDGMLEGWLPRVLAAGHTHQPMVREHKGMVLMNPGSVGLPTAIDPATGDIYNPASLAEYALLTWADGTPEITLRRVPVDEQAVLRAASQSGMPHADRWRTSWKHG